MRSHSTNLSRPRFYKRVVNELTVPIPKSQAQTWFRAQTLSKAQTFPRAQTLQSMLIMFKSMVTTTAALLISVVTLFGVSVDVMTNLSSLFPTKMSFTTLASKGAGGGAGPGGGDFCEARIQYIRDDLKQWVWNGGPYDWSDKTHDPIFYSQKIYDQFSRPRIQCNYHPSSPSSEFVNSKSLSAPACQLHSEGSAVTLDCDFERFLALNEDEQYKIIHRLFADLAELGDGKNWAKDSKFFPSVSTFENLWRTGFNQPEIELKSTDEAVKIVPYSTHQLDLMTTAEITSACSKRVETQTLILKKWLAQGEQTSRFVLPQSLTLDQYTKKMGYALDTTRIECVSPDDDSFPIAIEGIPKVCRYDTSEEIPRIRCDSKKFLLIHPTSQIALIHHEFAGIAGIETPHGAVSDYTISNQLYAVGSKEQASYLAVRTPWLVHPDSPRDGRLHARLVHREGKILPCHSVTRDNLDFQNSAIEILDQRLFFIHINMLHQRVIAELNCGFNGPKAELEDRKVVAEKLAAHEPLRCQVSVLMSFVNVNFNKRGEMWIEFVPIEERYGDPGVCR